MNDYLLQIKIKNNCLHRLMKQHGWKSVASLSKASGVAMETLYLISNLRLHPLKRDQQGNVTGEYRKAFTLLALFFSCHESELWPDTLLELVQSNNFEREIDIEQMRLMLGGANATRIDYTPEEMMDKALAKDALAAAMRTLKPLEREVLTKRMHGESLESISKSIDRTECRVGQIEAKAHRKLRPSRRLREFWEESA